MDVKKTGALIADRRRERGWTQKQLAEALQISDRTVSKWERGAGFPDVTLLPPLADALELSVTALLQGDEALDSGGEASVRNAIAVIYTQTKNKLKKNFLSLLAALVLALLFFGVVYAALSYRGVFLKDVALEVPVGIYADGQCIGQSTIFIEGKHGKNTYSGTFAIGSIEKTTRPEVLGYVNWGKTPGSLDTLKFWGYGGPFDCGIEQICYISGDMRRIALKTTDGAVIASDDDMMALMMLSAYYPLDF